MLKIRLQRVGRVNNPSFRLVLTDSRNATKSGKYLEVLGHFDYRSGKGNAASGAKTESADNHLDADKIKHWISKGAQPTPSVHNILLGKGIITGKKINVLPRKSPPKKEEPAVAKEGAKTEVQEVSSAPVAETPTAETPAADTADAVVAEPVKA